MNPRQQRTLMAIGILIAILLVALIVVFLTGDDGTSTAAGDTTTTGAGSSSTSLVETTTTTAAATTSTSPTSTTTTSATSTTAPAGACAGLPSATIPGPEPGVTFASGDFDGNGIADQLIAYEDAGGTWWVQLALDYGYATQTAVPGPVEALGATDFGTGQDVAYAYVDHGASAQLVGFFYLPGCDVFEATVPAGSVARFPVGGGVTHLDGVTCDVDGISTTSATTADGVTWDYSTTAWAWVPGLGEFQAVSSAITTLTSPGDDAIIFTAADFACPDTTL